MRNDFFIFITRTQFILVRNLRSEFCLKMEIFALRTAECEMD